MSAEGKVDFMNPPEAEVNMDTNDENMAEIAENEHSATENEHSATDIVQKAIEKLKKEKASATNKSFADPILGYIEERVKESVSLAKDVMQPHKSWKNCYDYIFNKAKAGAKGSRSAAYTNEVVYEWAEDYFHADDKKEAEKKAKQEAEQKKKEDKPKDKKADAPKPKVEKPVKTEPKKEETTAQTEVKKSEANEKVKEKKAKKPAASELDGQMDIFSMFGM